MPNEPWKATGPQGRSLVGEGLLRRVKHIPIREVANALAIPLHHSGNTSSARCLSKGEADTKPSLKLWLAQNRWKCFSCHDGGDVIALVQKKRLCGFPQAVEWLCTEFGIERAGGAAHGDALATWASLRGVKVESVRAFGARASGDIIRFPMRLAAGGKVVGWQERRADNEGFRRGERSRCGKGSRRGLFIPGQWPPPSPDDLLVIPEGEPDAIAAHSCGFCYSVGTPGTAWSDEIWNALRTVAMPFRRRVLIMDGDVRDEDLYERAVKLGAEVVRVPAYVSAIQSKRDLNEWIREDGEARVREVIRGHAGFTALLHTALPDIERAVKETSGLQARIKGPLRLLVLHLLQKVLPTGQRKCMGVEVGPGQWVATLPKLAAEIGATKKTVRTCLDKLKLAGLLEWRALGGKKGLLVTLYNLSEFVRTTPETFGFSGASDERQE
jgi:hypothetical protein